MDTGDQGRVVDYQSAEPEGLHDVPLALLRATLIAVLESAAFCLLFAYYNDFSVSLWWVHGCAWAATLMACWSLVSWTNEMPSLGWRSHGAAALSLAVVIINLCAYGHLVAAFLW